MKRKAAFNLIELSIFVAITSIILVLITYSDNLSKTAESRAIMAEVTSFKEASNNFYGKYGYLPGDFPFSDKFFGTRCSATATDCNGDGNGLVNYLNGNYLPTSNYTEPLLYWRHLGLSGFLKGDYVGQVQDTVDGKECNNNWICCFNSGSKQGCPKSSYNNGEYMFFSMAWGENAPYQCGAAPDINHLPRNLDSFIFGKHHTSNYPANSIATPEFAYKLDKKYDDGIPTKGIIQARNGYDIITGNYQGDCIDDSSDTQLSNQGAYGLEAVYKLTETSEQCYFYFIHTDNSLCPLP